MTATNQRVIGRINGLTQFTKKMDKVSTVLLAIVGRRPVAQWHECAICGKRNEYAVDDVSGALVDPTMMHAGRAAEMK